MDVLSLKNVCKSYKMGDGSQFPVLKGINISFEGGELVSIIGESGSGKSTLMNIIGGLDSKFEGEVLVGGKILEPILKESWIHTAKVKLALFFKVLT